MGIQHHVQCSVQTLGGEVVIHTQRPVKRVVGWSYSFICRQWVLKWGLVSCRVEGSVVIQFPVRWVVLESPPPHFPTNSGPLVFCVTVSFSVCL